MERRTRLKVHSDELLKCKKVGKVGAVAAFSDPKNKVNQTLKIEFSEEYGSYLLYCTPKFYSIEEAIEDFESKF